MGQISKLFARGGNTEGDNEANTPLGTVVPKEYQGLADTVYAGLEMVPYVGSALGVVDVGNDLYNMYKNRDVSLRSVGNLLFDTAGLIPGVKTFSKAADLAKVANATKQSEKLNNQYSGGGPVKKKPFEDWYKTVPADRNDTTSYNLRRAYELAPYDELEAWRTSSIKDLEEGKNHLRSVYLNPNTGVYEFMKSKNHPTLHFETDWYNSNDPEAVKFRKNYDLDMSGNYYKYVPEKKAFGGDLNTLGGHLFVFGGEEDPFNFLARVKKDYETNMANAPLADTTTPRQKAILAIATGTPEGQQAAYEYWKTTQDPELFKNATTPEVKSEAPTTSNTTTPNTTLPTSGWQTMMRYAPIVGGISTVFSAFVQDYILHLL